MTATDMDVDRFDDRPLLTVADVQDRLRLSERTVRGMLANGTIPSIKVEGTRRVLPAALDEYLARDGDG